MLFVSGRRSGGGLFSNIGCLIFGALFLFLSFVFLRWLYKMLWIASPVFLAVALVVNWRIVAATLRNWWMMMQRNPLGGIGSALFGALLFPFLTMFWMFGALGAKKIERMQQEFGQQWGSGTFDPFQTNAKKETEFVDFEEIESRQPSEKASDRPTIELPPQLPKSEKNPPSNPYDNMFT